MVINPASCALSSSDCTHVHPLLSVPQPHPHQPSGPQKSSQDGCPKCISQSSCQEPRLIGLTSCHSDLGLKSSCSQAGGASLSGWGFSQTSKHNQPPKHTLGAAAHCRKHRKLGILPTSHWLPCNRTPQAISPRSPDLRVLPRPSTWQSLTPAR